MNVKKILCPVDLSTNSLKSIEVASSLAKVGGGELIFLFVAMPELPVESGYAMIEADAAVQAAKEELDRIKPTQSGVEFRHEIRRGDPATEIIRCAEHFGCDMIVMTTHGRSGIPRLLIGSVAEHVIRHATCPVITLRMQPVGPPKGKRANEKSASTESAAS